MPPRWPNSTGVSKKKRAPTSRSWMTARRGARPASATTKTMTSTTRMTRMVRKSSTFAERSCDCMRDKVTAARRRVIKIGSALLVSSGAVAPGMTRLGWSERPKSIQQVQAAAAVGQMDLVQAWESSFEEFGLTTAQVLLTHDDLSDRKRYLNCRSTLRSLLDLGVIPVINENDTVVTDEIRFGRSEEHTSEL